MDIVKWSVFVILFILFAAGASLMAAVATAGVDEDVWEKEWNKRFHPSVDLSEEQSRCNLEEGR